MAKVTHDQPSINQRKDDHIQINLDEDVSFKSLSTGLEHFRFIHNALPEIDKQDICLKVNFLGKDLSSPLLISSMTGGTEKAFELNRRLALSAEKHQIAIGVGSQRIALESPQTTRTFMIREFAPTTLIFANMGAIQLNYGLTTSDFLRAVEIIEADALFLHFNPLQEAVQPEGQTNWSGIIKKVEKLCNSTSIPIIAKEVGWGFSRENVKSLIDAGITGIDASGAGGTSWSEVEYYRAESEKQKEIARAFISWGIPTSESLKNIRSISKDIPVIASGGIRDGIEVAKCIALGANICGLANPFLKAAAVSEETINELIDVITEQLRITMMCSGILNIKTLHLSDKLIRE